MSGKEIQYRIIMQKNALEIKKNVFLKSRDFTMFLKVIKDKYF